MCIDFVHVRLLFLFFLLPPLVAGITSYVSQRNRCPSLNSLILIAIIFSGVIANSSPSLIYQYENGKNQEAFIRYPSESEAYGLKITQLLMPINSHRIPYLAKLSEKYSKTCTIS